MERRSQTTQTNFLGYDFSPLAADETATERHVRRNSGPEATEAATEQSPFMSTESEKDARASGLALYEDDFATKQKISHLFRKLSIYNCTVPPVLDDAVSRGDAENIAPSSGGSIIKKKSALAAQRDNKMGTFMGVYLPCLQNIFGVLFFIRLAWIVGTAGILEGFFIALICCSVTFLTSISLSAIATNGIVPGGGPYFMISRNLGPEVGGAVGILFYLGTTVAASMYITGAVEIFIYYLLPQAKIFDDISQCFRLYGTGFLIIIGLIVMAGMRVVNKFALPGCIVVCSCIIMTFIGIFVNVGGSDRLQFCMVGDRSVNILEYKKINKYTLPSNLTDNPDWPACNSTDLMTLFCSGDYESKAVAYRGKYCDEYFVRSAKTNRIRKESAIRGLQSGAISDNFWPKYRQKGEILSRNKTDIEMAEGLGRFYVAADMLTSFIILIGVFFPSVTGIMAGSNRSGDLRDASHSIPIGTIAATTTSSIIYLSGAILFGASVHEMFIRDKFGESGNGKLVIAELAVPHPKVIEVGCFLSTMGAALQSLTGAPRLLQAISKDGVIPVLAPFQVSTRFGEPLKAQFLTFSICLLGILIAELESLTALITQFFLMCYLSTNAACALQSLLRAPGWRPRFRYYHWTMSLLGACLCFAVMFMSHWWFALIAIGIGIVVYKYIEYRGAEKEWGDGIKGLALSTARYALLKLEEGPPHTKNWRPQILVLCNTNTPNFEMKHSKLLAFTSQLKAGRGLTVLASVVEGPLDDEHYNNAQRAKDNLKALRNKFKLKGFCDALVAANMIDGLSALIQTSGLGGLKHNTVIIGWPSSWQTHPTPQTVRMFCEIVRVSHTAQQALFVLKNVDKFPDSQDRIASKIDVWWVVHDGGLLLLIPFLLRQHKTWKGCRLRVFVVAEMEDNSVKMKQDLKNFMYQLRIDAEVEVIEMTDRDISMYTYERTLVMEQRNQVLRQLRLSDKEKIREIQAVRDHSREGGTELSEMSAHNKKLSLVPEIDADHEVRQDASQPSSGGNLKSASDVRRQHLASLEDIDNESDDVVDLKDYEEQPPSNAALSENLAEQGPAEKGSSSGAGQPSIPAQHHEQNNVQSGKPTSRLAAPSTGLRLSAKGFKNKPDDFLVRRMDTAVKLNPKIKENSGDAHLVVINLPPPPDKNDHDEHYMEFVEVLTEGIDRVLMIRGGGYEVVTIYS